MSRLMLGSPISGWLINVRDVPDPVFSEEMMGVGLAVDPTEGVLVAPCDATVLLVAPTQHSVTLRTDAGAELLIHVGLETVGLEGRGFEARVRDGDRVALGDPLISFDLDAVAVEAKSLVTPIVLTNVETFELTPEPIDRLVERGDAIAWIEGGDAPAAAANGQGPDVGRDAVVGFEHGLHARPAAKIADCAKRFDSAVTIRLGDKTANARSPVAIMALNAGHGDRIEVRAAGEDREAAVEAIVAVLCATDEPKRGVPAERPRRALAENEIGGVSALAGVVVGTAAHWRRDVVQTAEQGRGVAEERSALEHARANVRARLLALSDETNGPASTIARAHIGLLDDEELNAAAAAEIDRGLSAGRAWQLASDSAAEALRNSENTLLKERIADIRDVSAQVAKALAGSGSAPATGFADGTILLADELLPSEFISLPRDRIVGLATSGGGPTSHMAIIAASFGIPTLVAMGPRLADVREGTRVLLDATAGVLVVSPDDKAQARAEAQASEISQTGDCLTRDGERVRLLANLGSLVEVEAALAVGAEGCGLLRTEFLFLDRAEAPSAEEQRAAYQAIADALGNRPLTIRTLDIGGDKPVPYIRFPDEQNPALGARGIRTELFAPELLDEQLRAIAEVRGDAVKVMLPMISSVAELRVVMDRLRRPMALGVMIETPAAALIADRLATEADFLSIGSNDLAQYALAMDRTNPLLAAGIDALHPAVLRLIAMTAEAGRAAGTPVSLCGGLASDPLGALVLVGFGICELSAVPAAIPAVRGAVSRVSAADCRTLAQRALTLESAGEVRALAAELLTAADEGQAR